MNMMEQIWKIRDSRGLTVYEKVFLTTIASRGEAGMFCEWRRNSEDMSMKKDSYYKTRNSLKDKGLISAQTQSFGPTIYKINDDVLIAWHSATQNDVLSDQKRDSVTQNGRSVSPERKKNTKKNKKINTEELDEAAGASPSPLNDNKIIKEDQDEGAILNGDNTPAVPKVGNSPRHSATQNDFIAPWEIELEQREARLRQEGLLV